MFDLTTYPKQDSLPVTIQGNTDHDTGPHSRLADYARPDPAPSDVCVWGGGGGGVGHPSSLSFHWWSLHTQSFWGGGGEWIILAHWSFCLALSGGGGGQVTYLSGKGVGGITYLSDRGRGGSGGSWSDPRPPPIHVQKDRHI